MGMFTSRIVPVAIAAMALAAPVMAEQVRVNNNTSTALYYLQFSEANNNNWGPDQIPQGMVQPGGAAIITIPGGRNCVFDFRMTYIDGVVDTHRMDICENNTLNLID